MTDEPLSLTDLLSLLAVVVACLVGLWWLMECSIEAHNRRVAPPAPVEQPAAPKPMQQAPVVKPDKPRLVWRNIYSDARIRRIHWGEQAEANCGRT